MRTEDRAPNLARRSRQAVLASCLGLLIAFALLAPAPAAALPPRPPRPTVTPRPTPPTPTAQPSPRRTLIMLVFISPEMPPAGWQTLWTGIQWQDAIGAWHDVEGWQGALDEIAQGVGKKTWVVAEGHLGSGPFRWLIYARQGDDVVAASRPFYLPSAAGDVYEVRVVAGR